MSAEDTRQNKIEETNKVLLVPNSRRVSQNVLLVKGNGTEEKKKKNNPLPTYKSSIKPKYNSSSELWMSRCRKLLFSFTGVY